jgi:hypothetical protein
MTDQCLGRVLIARGTLGANPVDDGEQIVVFGGGPLVENNLVMRDTVAKHPSPIDPKMEVAASCSQRHVWKTTCYKKRPNH